MADEYRQLIVSADQIDSAVQWVEANKSNVIKKIETLDAEVLQLSEDVLLIKGLDLQHMQNDVDDLKSSLNTLDAEVLQLTEDIVLIKGLDLQHMKSDIEDLQTNTYTKDETDTKITEKVSALVAGAPERFDTLKELADWIDSHADSAAAMNSAIEKNAADITTANAAITKNAEDVATANTNISKNASDISAANTAIEKNETDIATANSAIQQNKTDISTASTRISALETLSDAVYKYHSFEFTKPVTGYVLRVGNQVHINLTVTFLTACNAWVGSIVRLPFKAKTPDGSTRYTIKQIQADGRETSIYLQNGSNSFYTSTAFQKDDVITFPPMILDMYVEEAATTEGGE